MILISLRLFNFRQFYGDNKIEFAHSDDKNVTLVHGENGIGKTTILNAVLWCLFDKLNSDFERQEELVHYDALREGANSCSVELLFEYESEEYLAQRHHTVGSKNIFKVFKIDNQNYEQVPLAEQFVKSVLPPQMANYFFFHGEGITAISDRQSSDTFRRAVRDILGFTFAEQAIEDLGKIRRRYAKKAEEIHKQDAEAKAAAEAKSKADDRVEELQTAIKDLEKSITAEDQLYDDLSKKVANSGNTDAERFERELRSVSQRIKTTERDLKECHLERQALIPKYAWAIFGSTLSEKGLEFIDESTMKGRIPAGYQDSFVSDLLGAGQCICGRVIEAGTREYQAVAALLETANTAAIHQRTMKARAAAGRMAGGERAFLDEVEQLENRREELERRLRLAQDEEAEIQEALRNIEKAEIKRLTAALDACRKNRDEQRIQLGSLKAERDAWKERADRYKKDLSRYGGDDEQLRSLARYEELIDEMIGRCSRRLDEVEDSARSIIAETVNNILIRFSRKDYNIRVNQNFEFFLVREDGGFVAKSKGENLLLNLAFVAALIDMAKKREKAEGDFLVQGGVAPFVIDAPFGELDETYKGATAQFLPGTAKQIVLLLSSSHWKGTVDEAIKPYVGAEYVLISHRRIEKGDKPDDILRIGDLRIEQSVYGAERDATTITKVI